jgi:hypothetical protein
MKSCITCALHEILIGHNYVSGTSGTHGEINANKFAVGKPEGKKHLKPGVHEVGYGNTDWMHVAKNRAH